MGNGLRRVTKELSGYGNGLQLPVGGGLYRCAQLSKLVGRITLWHTNYTSIKKVRLEK